MENDAIADQLSLLSKLMDIHGENAFKSKSYASAAFTIEKLPTPLKGLSKEKLFALRGIGEGVGSKILELLEHGELTALKELVAKTPEGVLEMMSIKGLGPKKIHTLWKDLEISTLPALIEACRENRVAAQKGFGEKTQQQILEAIQFREQTSGSYLYAQVEAFVAAFQQKLEDEFPKHKMAVTGLYRRQMEVIDRLEWVTTVPSRELSAYLTEAGLAIVSESRDTIVADAQETLVVAFHLATEEDFAWKLFSTSCAPQFLASFPATQAVHHAADEAQIFSAAGLSYIPPFQRETTGIIERAREGGLPEVIQPQDVKGLIHSHSNWSDGTHTIEEMVKALIDLGFEYLVISDHSKAAFYAGGLTVERIREQHKYIDTLNKKYAPFKVFKSIECDILSDGSLDYPDDVLATFDLVIASVHSNLQMKEEKAMMRLLSAIENPYITVLGHLTGRRLLKRAAYPVDHKAIIDACAEQGVVIEINANPQRLDMKWEWVEYALEKNLFLSINPDAHSIEEFGNIKYGVLVGQKGGLTKGSNLSSLGRAEFEAFLKARRELKGL